MSTSASADLGPDGAEVAGLVAHRGLAVFPLPPGGRRPDRPGWQDRCLTDPEEVRRVWVPGDNVGVGCRASRVLALDLDRDRVDGVETFRALCATHGQPWPLTLTTRTAHHGLHLFFRAQSGSVYAPASRGVLGPGIDIRGPGRRTGGYLIGPGSVVDGRRYRITRDVPIAALPGWLYDRLSR
jgi:hypothetical protein